jgi:hypothetical protein
MTATMMTVTACDAMLRRRRTMTVVTSSFSSTPRRGVFRTMINAVSSVKSRKIQNEKKE